MNTQKTVMKQFLSIEVKDNKEQTALHLTVKMKKNNTIVQLLLNFEYCYDSEKLLNTSDNNRWMMQNFEVRKTQYEFWTSAILKRNTSTFDEMTFTLDEEISYRIMKMLMKNLFSIEDWLLKSNNEGQTALHLTVKKKKNEAVVKLLLNYDDKFALTSSLKRLWLKKLNNEEQTALHLAEKKKKNETVVKLLLNYGDKSHLSRKLWLNRPDKNEWTVIYWVIRQSENKKIINLLVNYHANIKKLNNDCVKAVLKWAFRNNCESTIKCLKRHSKKN